MIPKIPITETVKAYALPDMAIFSMRLNMSYEME